MDSEVDEFSIVCNYYVSLFRKILNHLNHLENTLLL